MNLNKSKAKDKVFQAAMELVLEGKNDKQITTREIALKAGVNLALINYYYQSKENLLSQVVGSLMGDVIEKLNPNNRADTDAQTRLRSILFSTADAAFKYPSICKIAISQELKSGCQNSCKLVIPILKEIMTELDESDLNIIAMQLMIPFHHIVLEPELYSRYLDTDFANEKMRKQKINQMINHVLSRQTKVIDK
ncbi:TetR family transcriptional regulator [Clostridium sp. 'deep sea']|uniref:TetR/AcrR family transcriptional regulator n=1 Tax=Clostridium sp. 'deep sea' TaxID=2779445 RepID=UPI0018969E18|nr:TetR family transcriptional regulator [Clostridium sp. 'deep sea']QOR35168.1 TetR family transcriptional regulator [Clostridium sp. 'deep sea']